MEEEVWSFQVAPLDVLMKKLFSLNQGKTESVTNFAIRLESTLANIQRDHPQQVNKIQMDASQRDRLFQGLKKVYRDSLRYLYNTGAPYQAILTTARKAEAEAEHYKESEPAQAKEVHAMTSAMMDELAAVKAIANKAWGSQQDQKKGKSGDSPKRKWKVQSSTEEGFWTLLWMWWNWTFHQRVPQPPQEVFKLQRGEPEPEDSPCREEGLSNFHRGPQLSRRYQPRGWARTGLEPEVTIFLEDAPFDALIDMNSDYSMIDSDLCRYLQLDVTPFQYDIPLCMGVEGVCMTKSIVAILGWVDLKIGIASLGLANLRFWVADTISCKGTPFIIGTNQIKRIFNQVDTADADNWPQPWRSMHYRFFYGNWSDSYSEDFCNSENYDTEEEDSFEALCKFEAQSTSSTSNSSLDSWLKVIEYPTPHEEVEGNQEKEGRNSRLSI